LITLIIFSVKCTSYKAPHYAVFSILPPLPPNILFSYLFSRGAGIAQSV
jgi:hypothetical protein